MKFVLTLLLISTPLLAGFPPTTTKTTGDSSYVTTFNVDFDQIPLTHTGITTKIGTIPVVQGGTGSSIQNFVDLTTGQSINGVKNFVQPISGSVTGTSSNITSSSNSTITSLPLLLLPQTQVTGIAGQVGYVDPLGVYGGDTQFTFNDLTKTLTVPNLIGTLAGDATGTSSNITSSSNSTLTSLPNLTIATSQISNISKYVDTSSNQTIGGTKTFSSTISGSINGNASTVTTNANLTGPVTSVGNATSVAPGALSLPRLFGTGAYRIPYASATNSWLQDSSTFTYNDATSTLTAPNIVGTLAGNATGTASNITSSSNSTITSLPSLSLPVSQTTGVLQLNQGGTATNTNSSIALFGALSPTTQVGDMEYRSALGAGGNSRLASGVNSQVLASNAGIPSWKEYDPLNMLVNPSFENGIVSWSTANSTVITATTNTSYVFDPSGVQAVVASATNSRIGLFQDITPPSGMAGTQGVIGVSLLVPSQYSDVSVCSRVNGATSASSCITAANNGVYREYEVPFVFGTAGQTAGIDIRTAATYTSSSFIGVDKAKVKAGLSMQNLNGDNMYSATISATGVISNSNKSGWITACTVTATSTYTCPLVGFTVAPGCTVTPQDSPSESIMFSAGMSSTQAKYAFYNSGGAATAGIGVIHCQKQGADYTSSSSAVYSQASANFGSRNDGAIGITSTGSAPTKGTIVRDRVLSTRMGNRLIADYQYEQSAAGSSGTGDYLFALPSGMSFDSNYVNYYTGTIGDSTNGTPTANSLVGYGAVTSAYNASTGYNTFCQLYAYDSTHFRIFIWGGSGVYGSGVGVYLSPNASNYFYLNLTKIGYNFHLEAPISGWSSSQQIVGSFARTATTVQTLTAGTGTYTLPNGVRWIKVKMQGAGGGGAGSGTGGGSGGTGNASTFGTSFITANGGSGGAYNGGGGGPAGASYTVNSPAINVGSITGGNACGSTVVTTTTYGMNTCGGASRLGVNPPGGTANGAGQPGTVGAGGGGGGLPTGLTTATGPGGAGAGYVEAIIESPSSTYPYGVGQATTGGTAGTSGQAGGAGGAGVIIVEEYYQ